MLKKILFKIPYPKLLLLIISLYIGRLILTDANNFHFHSIIERLGYAGTFFAGIFLPFGLTFGPAAAVLILAGKNQNFLISSAVACTGALIGSYTIFSVVKLSFETELKKLSSSRLFSKATTFFEKKIPLFVRRYILPVFAGIIVATPLPEELGVALVAASQNISVPIFYLVSFFFSTFGIFILIALGRYFM